MLISIVIPVYNSEQTIRITVDKIVAAFNDKYDYEVILVNDGSEDDSDKVCRDLCDDNPEKVVYLQLMRNFGEHNALMAGLKIAKGDWIITMDDDLQNPVTEVVKLAEFSLKSNYDVIYTKYLEKCHNFWRNLGSRFNDKVANIMLKKPPNLYLSSFRAISRAVVNEIIKYDLPFPYIDGIIINTTNQIGVLEVVHSERAKGKSGYTLRKLLRLWSNMFTNYSILPLRIAIFSGFIFSILGFILGVMTVIEKLMNPELPLGYASLFVALAMFSGIILVSLGMLGEYIGRIFLGINGKPQYVIKEKYEKRS
ncbi:MAG: glycosyltransferase family 2 protein [Candidatus Cloacimonetes bacterium]|nr:glycosyltransferase family 2 protein [Candidatus Cloacimonadota bacterium]